MKLVKPQAPTTSRAMKPKPANPRTTKLKSGLPGTPEEQRRQLRAAIKEHAETLRRLAK